MHKFYHMNCFLDLGSSNRSMDASYFYGIKAQYNHARLIARKLSVEISKDVKSYWELS